MALDKSDGSTWKPYNEVIKATLSSKKSKCNYTRFYGTLCAEFSKVCGKVISHYYPTNKVHICYNPTVAVGQIIDTHVPLMLVFPSPSWNISKAVIDNMKEYFSSVSDRHWTNQSHCKTAWQHLKELAAN
jgi:hypothetical protein